MKLKKARFFNTGRVIPQTYETPSGLYQIEKGTVGWNLYLRGRYGLEYVCTYDTLRDVRNDPNLE